MAQIPTVPGYSPVQTVNPNQKLDFSTLDQPNRGRAQVAAAIGDVGRTVGDFALKLQGAVNFGIAADADRKMRQAAAEFQQSLVGRTDEDKWSAEWEEKSGQVWSQIEETTKMGPALRRQLTNNFTDWRQSNAIEVGTMANKQRINRAVERVGLAADEAARDGDEHGINVAFDGAVENHLLLPETAKKLKTEYLTKIDEYAAKNFIMSNPSSAVDYLEEKDKSGKYVNLTRLTPDQRLTVINMARVQFTKFQEQNYQDLIGSLQDGVVKTPAELSGLVAQGVITARQRKSYETAYRHGNFNTKPDDIGAVFTEINSYDPASDPKFEKRATIMAKIATSGFPTNIQADMNQLIGLKSDPKSLLNSPVAKDAFEGIDQRFKLGLYGKYESKIEQSDGSFRTVVNPKVYEQAMNVKRRVEDATRKFLADNPKATAEQVNAFISDVQMSNVLKAGRGTLLQTVLSSLPASDMSVDERNARLDAILAKEKK